MGKRVQNFNLKNLETKVINLGYVGENVHTQIVIECSEVLWDYPNAVASMVVQPPRGDLYPVDVTREENNIIWEITASDVVYAGSGRVQLTFTNNGEIVKSAVGTTRISGSIEATGEAPEPLQNWMDQAEETARQMGQDVADATLEDLEETKEDCIAEIEQAGADTLATIPADYTQLSDDVTSLKSAFEQLNDNVIVESAGPASIVSIADGADGMPMRKVEVAIEPVQDLHGYDYPWPAGGGKNLLEVTATTNTINGVTFTVNEDGTVIVNGTATADTAFIVGTWVSTGEQIVLNGCPIGGSTSTYRLFADHIGTDTGAGLTKTPEAGQSCPVKVNIYNGVTANNLLYQPMIRLATETDATYAPYSNVCPISGWTGVKVTRTGKNLFNIGLVNTSTNRLSVDGTTISKGETGIYVDMFSGGQGSAGVSRKVLFLKAGTYTVSGVYVGVGQLRIYKLDDDATVSQPAVAYITEAVQSATFTIAEDNYYTIRFGNRDAVTVTNLQLEPGSTATAYEPYQGQTYEVTFPADPGTVYGGTLDVVTGLLTVDVFEHELDEADTMGIASSGESAFIRFTKLPGGEYFPASKDDAIVDALNDSRVKCSHLNKKSVTTSSVSVGWIVYHSGSNTYPFINFRFPQSYEITTVDAMKEYITAQRDAGTPITICYPLATPITYQLTPTEIKTLLGINNVWSDAGNTSITYPADTKMYIDRKITEAVANALNA